MVGPSLTNIDPNDTPDRRTQEIFDKMDENHDGVLTKEEFVKGCMADEFLYQMLTADTSGGAPWPTNHLLATTLVARHLRLRRRRRHLNPLTPFSAYAARPPPPHS